MKDVGEILSRRLQLLEKPFSREWLLDFHGMMNFLDTNSQTRPIAKSIEHAKIEDHGTLIQNLRQMLKDGRKSLQQCLLQTQHSPEVFHSIKPKAEALLKITVDPENLKTPFSELDSIFHHYYRDFSAIVMEIGNREENSFIAE